MKDQHTKFYLDAKKIWGKIANEELFSPEDLKQQLEFHKRLFSVFHPGKYYLLIFDLFNGAIANISDDVKGVLGYEPGEITAEFLMNKIHPEDKPYFLLFEDWVTSYWKTIPAEKYKNYKFQYDVRFKRKDDKYARILMQYVQLNYDEQNMYHSFHCHTDISHIKPNGEPCCSLIGLDGEPSFYNIKDGNTFSRSYDLFTNREREILKLIVASRSSKQIAEELFISLHTVNTHRKNILAKASVGTPVELVSKALHEGWI